MNRSKSPHRLFGMALAIALLTGCDALGPPTAMVAGDVREAWYGNYLGTTTGRYIDVGVTWTFRDDHLWLQIKRWEDCGSEEETFPICPEDLSWGVYAGSVLHGKVTYIEIRLYLPEDLADAQGLTLTEDTLTVLPTEEFPYEIVIERENGELRGQMTLDWGNPIRGQGSISEQWDLRDIRADPYAEPYPPSGEP